MHRDLKPDNILIRKRDDYTSIALIDFGTAARHPLNSPDKLKEMVGTMDYIAPEVINQEYDHKADIWSIGAMTYFILSGTPPFSAGSEAAL